MKVLIVAKTRRGGGACVGGIAEDGRSVRLVAVDAETNERAGLEYEVGEVWEIEAAPDPHLVPPHVENIVVLRARRLRRSEKIEQAIRRHLPPVSGGPERLFDGRVQATVAGALYVTQRTGLPYRSTMFWMPDHPLQLDCEGKRIRYRYPTDDGGRTLTFVGFQDPLPRIPAGTLLRISLAHWWRPKDKPDEELRCFVQLSGWFLESRPVSENTPRDREPRSGDIPVAASLGAGRQESRPSGQRFMAGNSRSDAEAVRVPPLGGPSTLSEPPKGGILTGPNLQRARAVLKQTFGFAEFLPVQADVIARVLQRQDTLGVMPTGGGKSLCYQLPALLFDGLTAVVSPLIALMQDQVSQLRELDVPAAFLNSTLLLREYTAITSRVRHGGVRILYAAPETLLRPETLLLLEQSRLACLAVDEAHCISEWGHDFRPEYRQLQEVRRRFSQAVCLALTATATARVRADVRRLLGIGPAGEFVASFNRPNLFLAVALRRDGLAQALAFLEKHRGQSGIIYCGTRKQADELTAALQANGWPALPYHAGLEGEVRRQNQERFIRDDVPLMVATVAFGMGINKSNVRFVIHAHLPKDVESYYQEIGRAGRDGLPADCLLLYSRRDAVVHRHFIEEGAESERPGRQARLNALLRYAEARDCRRIPLLAYFGETLAQPCGHCDNCVRAPQDGETADAAVAAQKSDLFQRLRDLRKALADAAGVPAYVIFSDRALTEMATFLPLDESQFLAINGVGEAKLANYGGKFLQAIRDFCQSRGLKPKPTSAAAPPVPIIRPVAQRRFHEIGKLFVAGQSVESIAERYGILRETVIQNLDRFHESGGRLDPARVLALSRLPERERRRVLEAFGRFGLERLAPIHEHLARVVGYDELHLLRLYLRCGGGETGR